MAINPKIKQKAEDIRNKIFGSEVRESLASGIEAISEDVEATIGRQGYVEEQFQDVLDETTGKDVISAPELIAARNGKSNLKTRLDDEHAEVTAQLQQITDVKRALGYYFNPEIQPPARKDQTGWFTDAYNWTSDEYITNNFEPLRLANPNYITRTNLGKDQSGTYDIWEYQFTPKNYTKTIVINTCIHGGEVTPMIAMIRFLHYLVNDWEQTPALADIRENVRIIYIPFVNPWGVNQSPRQRNNSRNVDLNRNFDYIWDTYVSDFKGTAPFSEVETQYVRKVLTKYSDVTAYLDFHNTGQPLYDYYVNVPVGYKYNTYHKLLGYFTKDIVNPNIVYSISNGPDSCNYGYNTLGISSSTPEWCDTRFGGSVYSSTDITNALKWFSNIIIEHCREFSNDKPIVRESYFTFGGANIPVTSSSLVEVTQLKKSFKAPCDGIVLFEGFVTIMGSATGGIYTICPMLGAGTAYNIIRSSEWDNYIKASPDDRISISFQASIPVDKKINAENINYGLAASSAGATDTMFIYRYRGRITFIPNDTLNFKSEKITI